MKSGLVAATTGSDRRRWLLHLTDLGAQQLSAAYPLWERVQRMVAEELGDADIADLLVELRRLRDSSDHLSDT